MWILGSSPRASTRESVSPPNPQWRNNVVKKTVPTETTEEPKPAEKANGSGEFSTFTYSIKSNGEEMLVIRSNDGEWLC